MERAESLRSFSSAPPDKPTRRFILLGASNLTRGLATASAVARRAWSEPFDLLAAPGNGRSYGLTTNVVGRRLSSIVDSRLWPAWAARPDLPTVAVVTDVGNDVMYGATVEQILAWVGTVLERLKNRGVATVVTGLPLDRLRLLGPRQYKMLRTLLFPGNRAAFADSLCRSEAVAVGVRRLADEHGAAFVEPCLEWYGWDPIHIRRAAWGTAWSAIIDALRPPRDVQPVGIHPWSWLTSQFWRPEERHLFGFHQRRTQPSVHFSDGSRLSLF